MKPRDKKLAVLRLLGQESTPINLPDLLEKLGGDFKERTVRRWLNEMYQEGLIEKTGQRKSTKYLVVKGKTETRKEVSSCFGSESIQAIKKVRKPLIKRQPIAYNDDWFDSYIPNETFYIPQNLREQLFQAGKRASNKDPAGTYAHQIFNRLLIDLSYNSSRLEGNTYSRVDTERLLLHGDSAEGKLDEEKLMILNHKEAIRYIVDNAPRITITKETICTVHYLLSDGLVEARYAGKVRDHGVRIGGSTYIPYENPKRLELQLVFIVEKAAQILDPFEQSLFLLVHLSYLQTFADVNKRTARLSSNIPLITQNLVPLSFNDVTVDDYVSAIIAIYELQDVRPLVDLYLFSYMRTCSAYEVTVKSVSFDEIRVRYRQQRRAIVRGVIEDMLKGPPMLEYIKSESNKLIPENERVDFIEDVKEDLEFIDESRIVGLGITVEQLKKWMAI